MKPRGWFVLGLSFAILSFSLDFAAWVMHSQGKSSQP